MARWKKGQEIYDKLISSLAEYVSEQCEFFTIREAGESKVMEFAKISVPDFINGLRVQDLILIHEYLMYLTEVRMDKSIPVYVYSGGDRVAAVTRYIQKNIDLELAKQFA